MSYGLSDSALAAIRDVLARHPRVSEAVLFGSRVLGREDARSDVDIALSGNLDVLEAEGIALELDDLPLPVRFDVQLSEGIQHRAFREHLARAGQTVYSRETR